MLSLVFRPPLFFFWFTLHKSGRAAKIGKAWAHSSCEWTQGEHEVDVSGGGGWYLNMYKLSSKASSLLVMMSSIDQADVQNCDRALKQMIQCIAFAVGSLPLIHLHSLTWWMSPGLSNFSPLFRFCVLYWTQTEELKRRRPGNRATTADSTCTCMVCIISTVL